MQDAWRAYLELAMGLTEAPRKKAQDTVRRLVGSGGATAAQLQALGEELVSTGLANREVLTKLVRFEVDRTLAAVGLATADEVAELTRRVYELERQLREARATTPGTVTTASHTSWSATAAEPATITGASALTGTKAVAKKTVAKKTIAKKPPTRVTRTPADGGARVEVTKSSAPPAKKATNDSQPSGGTE